MTEFAVLVPVGPAPEETARVVDVLDALWTFEPAGGVLVLLDDAGVARPLPGVDGCPPGWRSVILRGDGRRRGGGRLGGLCALVLRGLRWVRENTDARFTLRLDTDALVVAPFVARLTAALDAAPDVGIAGSYDRTCNGEARDFSAHRRVVRRLLHPLVPTPSRRAVRAVLRRALANGYVPGEHCLAAACALSATLVARMALDGALAAPGLWRRTRCPDDVMLGIYTRAVGLRHANLTGLHQPFGLKYVGLPDTPEALVARGFSFVHSVKNDPRWAEGDIRMAFRALRRGVQPAIVSPPDTLSVCPVT